LSGRNCFTGFTTPGIPPAFWRAMRNRAGFGKRRLAGIPKFIREMFSTLLRWKEA